MKYIIIRPEDGTEFPVFCVAPKTHADLATAWRRNDRSTIVAAGFVDFGPFPSTGQVATFGESVSLKMGPRPQDARIISTFYRTTLATAVPPPNAAQHSQG